MGSSLFVGPRIIIAGLALLPLFFLPLVCWLVYVAIWRSRHQRQALVLRALAEAVERGSPLGPSLLALGGTFSGRLRHRVLALAELLEQGVSLGESAARVGPVLPPNALPLVSASWHAGRLDTGLQRAVELAERSTDPTRDISRLVFVLLLGLVVLLYMIYMSVAVLPMSSRIVEDFAAILPDNLIPPYAALLEWDGVTPVLGVVFIGAIFVGGAILFYLLWYTLRSFGHAVGTTPLQRYDRPALLAAVAQGISANVPLAPLLATMAAETPSWQMSLRLREAGDALETGQPLAAALAGAGVLRRSEVPLAMAAEDAGNLAWALDMLAGSLRRRQQHRWRRLVAILAPTCILVYGLAIAWLSLAMFSPLPLIIQGSS